MIRLRIIMLLHLYLPKKNLSSVRVLRFFGFVQHKFCERNISHITFCYGHIITQYPVIRKCQFVPFRIILILFCKNKTVRNAKKRSHRYSNYCQSAVFYPPIWQSR